MGAAVAAIALTCPECGAPLRVQPDQLLVACLYCHASCILEGPGSAEPAAVAGKARPAPPRVKPGGLSQDAVREIFELLHAGDEQGATLRCIEARRCTAAEAKATLEPLKKQVQVSVFRSQRAGALGLLLFTLAVAILVACVVGLAYWGLPADVALFVSILPVIYVWLTGRMVLNVVRFAMATPADATVRKSAVIGPLGEGLAVRVWLAVRTRDGRELDREADFAVAPGSLSKVGEGALVRVRCLGDDEVMLDRFVATRAGGAT